jgi:hypothetical protein
MIGRPQLRILHALFGSQIPNMNGAHKKGCMPKQIALLTENPQADSWHRYS